MTSYTDILNHPLTGICVGFLMGMTLSWFIAREKRLRSGSGTVYLNCKDCGREHALTSDGLWHALRSVEEIEAQAKRTPLGVPPKVPKCEHGIPVDRPCNLCKIRFIDPSDHNPRRG